MLVSLFDSSPFNIKVSTMAGNLQVHHLSKGQSLSLELRVNFSTMSSEFVGKRYKSFFLRLLSPFASRYNFLHIFHKQDVYRMVLLNEYSL